MPFGQELKEQREARGLSLDDVANATRVSVRHLEALEAGRFRDLPGGLFNRGIVRSYATSCGLNPEETVAGFQKAMRIGGFEPEEREDDWHELAEAVHRHRAVDQPREGIRWAGVAAIFLLLLLMTAGVTWFLATRGIVHLPEKKWLPRIHQATH